MKNHVKQLTKMHACKDAIDYAETYADPQAGWDACQRGDWMLWLCAKLSGEPGSDARKKLVMAACECARLALPHVRKGEDRPRKAIETAESWAKGGATIPEVRAAAAYAAEAALAAHTAEAFSAEALSAADAAYAASKVDNTTAYTTTYVNAARSKVLAQYANIVRKHYPQCPILRKEPP